MYRSFCQYCILTYVSNFIDQNSLAHLDHQVFLSQLIGKLTDQLLRIPFGPRKVLHIQIFLLDLERKQMWLMSLQNSLVALQS